MSDLISVIVPVYNTSEYLERCINSLIKQTYENLEILLINDGSIDDSLPICKKYAGLDDRIKVYDKENGGPANTRNYGLKVANGQYISFVDSDDWVEPDFYEYLMNLLSDNKYDLACVQFYKNDEKYEVEEKIIEIHNNEILMNYMCNSNIRGCIWNKLYSKNILSKMLFDETVQNCGEDVLFTSKILCNCKNVLCSNIPKYHYNTLNQSITRSILTAEKCKREILAHELQIKYLEEKLPYNQELKIKATEKLCQALIYLYNNLQPQNKKELSKILKNKMSEILKDKMICKFINKKILIKFKLIFYVSKIYDIIRKIKL